jgi:hypothetical protein
MRDIQYRRWAPAGSPLNIEFPAELLHELGADDTSGILYGWRRGREVRAIALDAEAGDGAESGEELEKVGVYVSRIRGEVFLTESDLAFLTEQSSELALVVAGGQAGFFVCESDGSIQTVRSHEEFSTGRVSPEAWASSSPVWLPPVPARLRSGVRAGAIALCLFPVVALAAVAVFPQRVATPWKIEVHETDRQLRISWQPAQNAVLTIDDTGGRVSIPVYADQSTVTYVPRGAEVDVSLAGVDSSNRLRRVSTHYVGTPAEPAR